MVLRIIDGIVEEKCEIEITERKLEEAEKRKERRNKGKQERQEILSKKIDEKSEEEIMMENLMKQHTPQSEESDNLESKDKFDKDSSKASTPGILGSISQLELERDPSLSLE